MDLVLGLSVTSAAVRWVLVEGATGDGDAVDRGVLDVADAVDFDADALLTVLLDANEAVVQNGVRAAGVTWTPAGEAIAGAILDALQARGVQNAVAVSEPDAAASLAGGISAISGYQDVAVCVFEPDATLLALVNADGVTVDAQELIPDRDVELSASVMALELNDRVLDAIFVVGSADLEPVVSSMGAVAAAPVISSGEADMAMARGAAVASALAGSAAAGGSLLRFRDMPRTTVLTSVVVAAAVTLVISLSVVLGLQATSDSPSETTNANATAEQLGGSKIGAEAKAALAAPKVDQRPAAAPAPAAKPAPAPAAPPVVETMVASPPPPAAIPDAEPPAYVPPAPAYVPPAPAYTPPAPAYVPPAPAYTPPVPAYTPPAPQVPAVQPEPRLRDKIIERIPIINRFHDPQPMYPTN
jgi:hypothetical protein